MLKNIKFFWWKDHSQEPMATYFPVSGIHKIFVKSMAKWIK